MTYTILADTFMLSVRLTTPGPAESIACRSFFACFLHPYAFPDGSRGNTTVLHKKLHFRLSRCFEHFVFFLHRPYFRKSFPREMKRFSTERTSFPCGKLGKIPWFAVLSTEFPTYCGKLPFLIPTFHQTNSDTPNLCKSHKIREIGKKMHEVRLSPNCKI